MTDARNQTIRQHITQCLETMPMSARDISISVRISEKDIHFHLSAIEKSIRHKGKKLHTVPYTCLTCGFEFKNRKTFKKPGRCPGCRNPRIAQAVFQIIDSSS